MKAVTRFIATDDSMWDSQEHAEARDVLDAKVRAIEARLPKRPKYNERVSLEPGLVTTTKEAVVALCREEFPNEAIFRHAAEDIHAMSYAGRFLADTGGPLSRVWFWFTCARGGWLYEQPFFALNPSKFEGKSLADAP